MAGPRLTQFYYITHRENVPSILQHGILSHSRVEASGLPYTRIYDKGIVEGRRHRATPDGKSLWDFANLYFQPRNAMLFRVKCERNVGDIAVLAVLPDVLRTPGTFIANGNAASPLSLVFPVPSQSRQLNDIRRATDKEFWKEEDGSKRTMMAEVLVPDVILPEHIDSVYVANHDTAAKVKAMLSGWRGHVIPQPDMFFEPSACKRITSNLSVLQGDMFFSRQQTLTVSVNIVGIMGRGLASRAKYQFPDVYVYYQDACRNKSLRTGRPFLYKRESSFDYQLADEPASLTCVNSQTWFLLFPTKRHWRDASRIEDIEGGLAWLRENYIGEGIESLAIPALGCGLGRLRWEDVGRLLCRYLGDLQIPVSVYLPAERKIPPEHLERGFLLGSSTPELEIPFPPA